jgi:hypothetical protein
LKRKYLEQPKKVKTRYTQSRNVTSNDSTL